MLVESSRGEAPGAHVADAVALVVEGGQGQPETIKDPVVEQNHQKYEMFDKRGDLDLMFCQRPPSQIPQLGREPD